MPPSIFEFIKSESARFDTEEIRVSSNWNWNFRRHVEMIFHMKNSMFFTGDNDLQEHHGADFEPCRLDGGLGSKRCCFLY